MTHNYDATSDLEATYEEHNDYLNQFMFKGAIATVH